MEKLRDISDLEASKLRIISQNLFDRSRLSIQQERAIQSVFRKSRANNF